MLIKPLFYDSFRCIASKCPDTCCAGWEIDVDPDTAEYYETIGGEDGEYVRSKLIDGEECKQLCREGERCRFLRDDNLCELIIRFGEEALCDICREHPRFYACTENLTEVGVGLCCPEAARLWLSEPCEFAFEDDGQEPCEDERELLSRQMEIIRYITNGGGTLGERLAKLICEDGDDDCLYTKMRELFSSLEALDENFKNCFSKTPVTVTDSRWSSLAAYFIFRYCFELGEELCTRFTAAMLIMTAAMGKNIEISAKNISKEVEYDTDNIDRICDFLEESSGLAQLATAVLAV